MNPETNKCVIVVDENLPVGIIANSAAILGMTLGKCRPELVGTDVLDKDGQQHTGIIEIPLPVLKTNTNHMKELRAKLYSTEYSDLLAVDFSDIAQSCKAYEDYIHKMADAVQNDLFYWGIAIYGEKKKVNKLTGSLPLLR